MSFEAVFPTSSSTCSSATTCSGYASGPAVLENLQRVIDGLSARVKNLEVESAALRSCLEVSGHLSAEKIAARVHQRHFAVVCRSHPCTWDAGLADVMSVRELMLSTVACACPEDRCALRATSRGHAGDVQRALAGLGIMTPLAMYICGGRDGQRCLNSVERFEPFTNMWTTVPIMLQHRAAAAAATLEGELYVCGGWSGQQYLSSVEVFCPAEGQWRSVAPMSRHTAAAAAAVAAGRLYVCGGWDGREALNDVERYDPATGTWETVAPMLQRRHGAAAVRATGCLYLCGGHDNHQALNSMEFYDPTGGSSDWARGVCLGVWEMCPNMMESRHGAAAAVNARKLYVFGGHNGHQALSTAERFDLATGLWEAVAPMAQRREGAGAAVIGGTLFVCGGLDGRRWAVGSAESFDPARDRWAPIEAMETRRAFVAAAPAPV